jgi:hypothetical protein
MTQHIRTIPTTTIDEYAVDLALQSILNVARMSKELRLILYEAALLEKQRREQVEQRLEEE